MQEILRQILKGDCIGIIVCPDPRLNSMHKSLPVLSSAKSSTLNSPTGCTKTSTYNRFLRTIICGTHLGVEPPTLKHYDLVATELYSSMVPDGYLWRIGHASDWDIVMDGNGIFGLGPSEQYEPDPSGNIEFGITRYRYKGHILRSLCGDLAHLLYHAISM